MEPNARQLELKNFCVLNTNRLRFTLLTIAYSEMIQYQIHHNNNQQPTEMRCDEMRSNEMSWEVKKKVAL